MTITFYDEITPAAPYLTDDEIRGWGVGEDDGTFVVWFTDGRSPIVGTERVSEFLNHQLRTGESVMTSARNRGASPDTEVPSPDDIQSDDPAIGSEQVWDLARADAAADAVTGIIERYTEGAVVYIGANATSVLQVRQAKQPWADLCRPEAGAVLGRVTMDTQAAEFGRRPTPNQPGVEQMVWVALPSFHPLFRANTQEIAVLRYVPSTQYTPTELRMVRGQLVDPEPKASGFDVSGFQAVVMYCGSLEQCERDRQELWEAVRTVNERRRLELRAEEGLGTDPDTDLEERAVGRLSRLTTREAWGV